MNLMNMANHCTFRGQITGAEEVDRAVWVKGQKTDQTKKVIIITVTSGDSQIKFDLDTEKFDVQAVLNYRGVEVDGYLNIFNDRASLRDVSAIRPLGMGSGPAPVARVANVAPAAGPGPEAPAPRAKF